MKPSIGRIVHVCYQDEPEPLAALRLLDAALGEREL